MNNFEKIKQMTVDEMAGSRMAFFTCPYDTPYVDCCDICEKFNGDCVECTKHWLESEADGD